MDLRPTVSDGIVLLYNYAVALSGGWVVMQLGIQDNSRLLAFTVLLAIGWTIYFRFGMVPRLSRLAASDEEPEGESL